MNPRRLLLVLLATAAVVAFSLPATTEAGSYRSRIDGTCGYCRGPVYSFYRPLGYDRYGKANYGWVMSSHTSCRSRYASSNRAYSRSWPSINTGFRFSTSPRYRSTVRIFGSPSYGLNSRRYSSGTFHRRSYCR